MLPKKYDPKESEPKWQKYWEEHEINNFNPDLSSEEKPVFSIDTPPPTVSGKMHMGHAFGNSQQDFIARYKRMKGFNVLQPLGTDDNGLPTKLLIEKLKKVRAHSMERKEFRNLCLNTLEKELKPGYINDWKRLGISCDYSVNYSTIDPHCQRISQKSFLDLHKDGRAYRQEAPAMWCPKCATAISQVECVDEDVDSFFNDIVFKADGEELIVATTRPELLPACVAVFYHPEDKRYQHLEGKKAVVPLFDFEVPILPDERADPEKGTGVVMCCTFGDQTDMEWQKAYKLPIKEAITPFGKMTELAGKYHNLKIEEARKQIISDMKEKDLLRKQEKIKHAVNCHERCSTPIEFIHSKQWFIKYLDLKDEMLDWGNELNWFPSHMKNRYDNWVKGLAWDWCISRQIPFGIPFPVWYCEDCDEEIFANEEDLPVDPLEDKPPVDKCPKCGSNKIIGEKDIINTWATSSLTPTIVKELFKGKPVYDFLKKNPMSLRPQGHDIISFWLFNTVIKSHLHHKMKPWNDCFINGWMLDPKGKKMSKSKGNIVEPLGMIEKYCADALRFMAGGCKLGDDLAFPEKELVAGQKFVTKLWNASKFCYMHLENYDFESGRKIEFDDLEFVDRWLLSELNHLIKEMTESFENYHFSEARKKADKFFWQTFCDNYLEIVKIRLYNEEEDGKKERISGQRALFDSLNAILKLFAPFTPHITEELYQGYFAEKEDQKSIHISKWPEQELIDGPDIYSQVGEVMINIISEVRKYKTSKNLSLKEEINEVVVESSFDFKSLDEKDFSGFKRDLVNTIKAKKLDFVKGSEFKIDIK